MKPLRIISLILFCLYIGLVAYLCFAKPEDIPHVSFTWFGIPSDKIAHILMFFPFPILAYLVCEPTGKKWYWKFLLMLVILFIGIGLAHLTENIQSHLTYRTSDIKDFYADIVGIGAGMFITFIYSLFRK